MVLLPLFALVDFDCDMAMVMEAQCAREAVYLLHTCDKISRYEYRIFTFDKYLPMCRELIRKFLA